VDFADLPTIKGKRELDRIIQARLARQKHYRLKTTLRFFPAIRSSVPG
jgi:hypothetical protein